MRKLAGNRIYILVNIYYNIDLYFYARTEWTRYFKF